MGCVTLADCIADANRAYQWRVEALGGGEAAEERVDAQMMEEADEASYDTFKGNTHDLAQHNVVIEDTTKETTMDARLTLNDVRNEVRWQTNILRILAKGNATGTIESLNVSAATIADTKAACMRMINAKPNTPFAARALVEYNFLLRLESLLSDIADDYLS